MTISRFRRCSNALLLVLLACVATCHNAYADHGSPHYSVTAHWNVGGAGGWDYLTADETARRLYVSRSDRVVVLDLDTGKPVGEIQHTDGVHGIALAADLKRGFVSNGRANSVTVFDTKTLATLQEVKIDAQNPDAIMYEPSTRRVFTFNGRSANATAIDAKTLSVLGTIGMSGKPEFAVADGRGRVYVNIEDKSELTVIDAKSLKVLSTWPLTSCERPTGLALDVAHHRLFSVCQNEKMVVTDANDGRQVATMPIGHGPDGAVFDASAHLVFSSNGDGTLTVVREDDPEHFSVVGNVVTRKSARTSALDGRSHRLFLAAAEFGEPPPATAEQPHPRPAMLPDTFTIVVVAPDSGR